MSGHTLGFFNDYLRVLLSYSYRSKRKGNRYKNVVVDTGAAVTLTTSIGVPMSVCLHGSGVNFVISVFPGA